MGCLGTVHNVLLSTSIVIVAEAGLPYYFIVGEWLVYFITFQ